MRLQRFAHLGRAAAHPADQRHRRAIDLVRRVRRHRIVAEPRRPAEHVGDGPAGEQDAVCRHRDAVIVRVGCRLRCSRTPAHSGADFVRYSACRVSIPTSSPIVGFGAGGPVTVTVTGAEKVTLTSIRSPAR